jgi:hypothetical protein
MALTRLQAIEELHDAKEGLVAAWDDVTTDVARQLEGWDDPASRVDEARRRVRLATGAANAALDQALVACARPH